MRVVHERCMREEEEIKIGRRTKRETKEDRKLKHKKRKENEERHQNRRINRLLGNIYPVQCEKCYST